ncbi:hypothetical protein GGR51DRAFT_515206 [Nemania sp. FL0031]|nr:hypothetical protein GGR51DRAFT_515206 [Nemania sp. FL0031]
MPQLKKSKVQVHPALDDEPLDDGPLFFYMPNAVWGEFCQWYRCTFTMSRSRIATLVGSAINEDDNNNNHNDDGNITFNCAEQFMMYCKAARFGDRETQRRVLATDSPKEQKRLGKLTAGFNDDSWDEIKSAVVVAGNVAKFGQNPKLGRKLLSTGDRLLVEAASRDRVWGIGYTAKHAMSHRNHWGENRLGMALMEARARLRKEGIISTHTVAGEGP